MRSEPDSMLDVAVIGAGPAGLAAGIHLARAGLRHAVFERRSPGGLLRSAGLIECYPGFPGGVPAPELVAAMVAQAEQLGVRFVAGEVTSMSWTREGFTFAVAGQHIRAHAVILATGTRPRSLPRGLLPEALPPGLVVSETAELPPDVADRRVWVSGGGDAAYDSALQLALRGAEVAIVQRGATPRALGLLVRRVHERGIPVYAGCELRGIAWQGEALRLRLEGASAPSDVLVWRLMICHGREPERRLWHDLTSAQARGPREVESHLPGLFQAGDLVRAECRYAAVAVGDGVRCARLAEAFLERYRGGSP